MVISFFGDVKVDVMRWCAKMLNMVEGVSIELDEGFMISKSFFAVIFCLLIAMPALAGPYHPYYPPDPIEGHGDGYDGGDASYKCLPGYYFGNGGEFTLYGVGLLLSNDAYSSDEDTQTSGLFGDESFQTFCLEMDEYAGNANIWVSEEDADGGDFGSHAYKGGANTNEGDDLDERTAYLYYQFAIGSLNDYDYIAEDGGRNISAGHLQLAIWYLEGEITYTYLTKFSQALAWVTEATREVESGLWSGIGDVRVLQMYDGCGYKQDFLYLEVVPVPVPAAVLLGAFGMAMAGIKLRKFA